MIWTKLTSKGNLINSKQPEYSKETCLVGYKGLVDPYILAYVPRKIISVVRGNSEKPDELWDWIEAIFPKDLKLEGFARRNLGRPYTIYVGKEVVSEMILKILNAKHAPKEKVDLNPEINAE